MIEIRGLTKRYGDKAAVQDLSLSLAEGEIFAFLGPNGAGKTTTLKVLAGLIRPTCGAVTIGGHDILTDGLAARRLISYVPDEPFLYEKLTAREFIRMVGDLYGMEREKTEERMGVLAQQFEITGFMDDLCETFSHGMKQRVVIAAALLHEPRALVIDEVTVGLDPKMTRVLKNALQRLAPFMSTRSALSTLSTQSTRPLLIQAPKFRSIFKPTVWLFSGWNWRPTSDPRPAAAQKRPP